MVENDVRLLGNLVRDPDLRKVTVGEKEVSVVNLILAVSRHFKKGGDETRKETVFVPCEAWDSGADIIGELTEKGSRLLIEGILRSDTWEVEGQKRSKLKVRISNFKILGGKSDRKPIDN